ncbi:MAG: hypothetical protein AAF639_41375 [Chloroflexota bacterium]
MNQNQQHQSNHPYTPRVTQEPSTTRPNLLFIMADQLRADFLGCYGADFVETPNID